MRSLLRKIFHKFFYRRGIYTEEKVLFSAHLQRRVKLSIFCRPAPGPRSAAPYSLLLINDGQDLARMKFLSVVRNFYRLRAGKPEGKLERLLIVGIHAGDRMQEYGTAHRPDYAKRGSRAGNYTRFVTGELLPWLEDLYPLSRDPNDRAFAGFSLGALSALDLVWNHPQLFGKAGIFSGSLWWRSKAFNPAEPDANLITHQLIRESGKKPGLKFWFQAGTEDEKEDRNKNGIIDAIDDTLSLIAELKQLGYGENEVVYVEVEKGRHHPDTWGKIMPRFLDFLAS